MSWLEEEKAGMRPDQLGEWVAELLFDYSARKVNSKSINGGWEVGNQIQIGILAEE